MRSLTIAWKGVHSTKLCASLRKMKQLRKLFLVAKQVMLDDLLSPPPYLQSLTLGAKLLNGMLPKWFDKSHLISLTQLFLSSSELRQDSIPFLGELPNLMYLHLVNEAFIEETIFFHGGLFSKLKWLMLRKLNHLNQVEIEKGALISLMHLSLIDCPNLMMVPLGIENLQNLQLFGLSGMPEELTSRLRRKSESKQNQEDLHRVNHIQDIWIGGSWN